MKQLTAFLRDINKLRTQRGFTMIELLIVISILGILAVAVLSAINPIEQINRGRDTGSQSDAEQMLSAIDRFYAFQGYYPWVQNPVEADNIDDFTLIDDAWESTIVGCTVLERLSEGDSLLPLCAAGQELKLTFVQRITNPGYNPIFIYNRATSGDSTYICFEPQSGAFKQKATERCAAGMPSDFVPTTDVCVTSTGNTLDGVGDIDFPLFCLP